MCQSNRKFARSDDGVVVDCNIIKTVTVGGRDRRERGPKRACTINRVAGHRRPTRLNINTGKCITEVIAIGRINIANRACVYNCVVKNLRTITKRFINAAATLDCDRPLLKACIFQCVVRDDGIQSLDIDTLSIRIFAVIDILDGIAIDQNTIPPEHRNTLRVIACGAVVVDAVDRVVRDRDKSSIILHFNLVTAKLDTTYTDPVRIARDRVHKTGGVHVQNGVAVDECRAHNGRRCDRVIATVDRVVFQPQFAKPVGRVVHNQPDCVVRVVKRGAGNNNLVHRPIKGPANIRIFTTCVWNSVRAINCKVGILNCGAG